MPPRPAGDAGIASAAGTPGRRAVKRIIAGTISDPATATNGKQPEEHPAPPDPRRDPLGQGRADHARHDPRRRQHGEHPRPLLHAVHPADRHVADRRHDAGAEALDEPTDDEDRHRRGQPADDQPDGEQHEPDDVGPPGTVAIGLLAGEDDADHRPEEERRRHPAVPGDAAEILGDVRQDRDHRQRLEGDQRHHRHQPDGQRAVTVGRPVTHDRCIQPIVPSRRLTASARRAEPASSSRALPERLDRHEAVPPLRSNRYDKGISNRR